MQRAAFPGSEFYSHGFDMEAVTVRWCEECGAVVIDTDVDSRTAPGNIMQMRLPQTELTRQREQQK